MENKEPIKEQQAVDSPEAKTSETSLGKRLFVEPEISAPVNILEATTFLQAVDSGPTN